MAKILIDARMYGLEHSGIGRYILNLTEELKNLRTKDQFVILLKKKYFNQLKFPGNWKKVSANVPHYTLREQLFLPLLLYREKADLFHALNTNSPLFYFRKFVVSVHDTTQIKSNTKATTLPLPLYYVKLFLYRFIFRLAMVRARAVFTPSQVVKDEIIRMFGIDQNKVHVVYEGAGLSTNLNLEVSVNVLKKFGLEKHRYFLYVGNAYPHKNLGRAIEAIKMFNLGRKDKIVLAIVSSRNVFTKRLEKIVVTKDASKYVKLLGFVPDDELTILYKNSVAFIFPSLSEGFGLPGLEAMASGTLVLASDIPVFREVYKDKVIYFDPYRVSTIIKAMRDSFAMNTEKREIIVKDVKEFIKRYSWQKTAKETFEVYRQVL